MFFCTGQHSQPFVWERDTHRLITLTGRHCHPLMSYREKVQRVQSKCDYRSTTIKVPKPRLKHMAPGQMDALTISCVPTLDESLAYAEAIPGNFDEWICAHFLRNLLFAHEGWAQVISCSAFHIYSPKGVRPSKHSSGLWKCSHKCKTGTIHSYENLG